MIPLVIVLHYYDHSCNSIYFSRMWFAITIGTSWHKWDEKFRHCNSTFICTLKRKFRSRSPTPSVDDHHLNSGRPRKWRKALYDRDPNVPDNYAPREFFLDAIERNKNLHKYSFGACVKGSCQVALQVRMQELYNKKGIITPFDSYSFTFKN